MTRRATRRDGRPSRDDHDDTGSTLIEVLIASVIMSSAVIVLVTGMGTLFASSIQNRESTTAGVVARSYAEAVVVAVATSSAAAAAATPTGAWCSTTYTVDFPSLPAGYTVDPAYGACPVDDATTPQFQTVTITSTTPAGRDRDAAHGGAQDMTARRTRTHDEAGAALELALVFLTAIAFIVGALLSFASTSSQATVVTRTARGTDYDADARDAGRHRDHPGEHHPGRRRQLRVVHADVHAQQPGPPGPRRLRTLRGVGCATARRALGLPRRRRRAVPRRRRAPARRRHLLRRLRLRPRGLDPVLEQLMKLRHRTGARRNEAGFTLPELILAIAIETIIFGALATAFVVVLNGGNSINENLGKSNDARFAANYIISDARNSSGPEISLTDIATCPDPNPPVAGPQTAVARFNWDAPNAAGTTTANIAELRARRGLVAAPALRGGRARERLRARERRRRCARSRAHPTRIAAATRSSITVTITETADKAGGTPFSYTLTAAFRKLIGGGSSITPSPPQSLVLFGNGGCGIDMSGGRRSC